MSGGIYTHTHTRARARTHASTHTQTSNLKIGEFDMENMRGSILPNRLDI